MVSRRRRQYQFWLGRLRECKGDRAVSTTAWTEGEKTNIEKKKTTETETNSVEHRTASSKTRRKRNRSKGQRTNLWIYNKCKTCIKKVNIFKH